jgi:hypothetical protein
MWTKLEVTVTPTDGSSAIRRAGHTLSILMKQDGRWLLARDANLLTTVNPKAGWSVPTTEVDGGMK